ncbi:MAG: hypothetical protein B6U72_00295 [Candidatus Altiarchaeales archaeon ex4484_2]|nr:MAG: hypothetical protein B6U72_00295 [Candidatus Altiarchaeales archaeon ex4484_2]
MLNKKTILLTALTLLLLQATNATTEYWNTPEDCVIDADQTDTDKTIIYTCDIIVNNSATWNLENVILKSNQTENWQYNIQIKDATVNFNRVSFISQNDKMTSHSHTSESIVSFVRCDIPYPQRWNPV